MAGKSRIENNMGNTVAAPAFGLARNMIARPGIVSQIVKPELKKGNKKIQAKVNPPEVASRKYMMNQG